VNSENESDRAIFQTSGIDNANTSMLTGPFMEQSIGATLLPGSKRFALADEGDATDSGYASAPIFGFNASKKEDTPLLLTANAREDDDKRTTYSVATTIPNDSAQQCIVDICKDIYAKISGQIDRMTWGSMSHEMPFLVKSFALQLGHGASDDISRRIMCFVHLHHQ
jgi:hypothetical protein